MEELSSIFCWHSNSLHLGGAFQVLTSYFEGKQRKTWMKQLWSQNRRTPSLPQEEYPCPILPLWVVSWCLSRKASSAGRHELNPNDPWPKTLRTCEKLVCFCKSVRNQTDFFLKFNWITQNNHWNKIATISLGWWKKVWTLAFPSIKEFGWSVTVPGSYILGGWNGRVYVSV